MIVRFWLHVILIESVLYAGLASLGIVYWQWTGWTAAAWVVGLLLSWRIIFAAFPFIYNHVRGYPEERVALSLGEQLRFLWGEIYFRFVSHFITMPIAPLLPDGKLQPNPQQIPVIFIHGLMCNRAIWQPLQAKLTQHGYHNFHSPNFEPLFAPIEDYLPQLQQAVAYVCQQTQHNQVVLVGHSMGGLIARLYAQRHPEHVAHIVTLATPHHGTRVACRFAEPNVAQMCVGTPFLERLNRYDLQNSAVPLTSIFSYHDNLNFPALTSVLPNAKNISFTGVAHQHILIYPQTFTLIWQEIQAVNQMGRQD